MTVESAISTYCAAPYPFRDHRLHVGGDSISAYSHRLRDTSGDYRLHVGGDSNSTYCRQLRDTSGDHQHEVGGTHMLEYIAEQHVEICESNSSPNP